MTLIEMEGFLKGKCLPGDLKVGETNAQYLYRKLNAVSELQRKYEELVITSATVISELQGKVEALDSEISRRDAIFVPLYPDSDLMNLLTDVFHDTVKIDYEEGGVENQESVITALINNFFKHIEKLPRQPELLTAIDSYLAEVRAQARAEGINFAASRLVAAFNHGFVEKPVSEVFDVVRMILTAKEEINKSPAPDGLSGEYAESALKQWEQQLRKELGR